jgi:hypothetical protein
MRVRSARAGGAQSEVDRLVTEMDGHLAILRAMAQHTRTQLLKNP